MAEVTASGQPAAPQLGESAHDKAMIAAVDAANGPAPVTPDAAASKPTRPEHIPEKFWDAEKGVAKVDEMAKSYAELERTRTQKPAEPAKPAAADGAINEAAKAAEEAAKAAGGDTSKVDFAALSSEYAEKGALSAEAYAGLEKAGLSKDIVDQFIAGQEAVAQIQITEAHSMAGGAEQYTSMLDWAKSNLPAAEQAAFDKAVIADPATRKQAITALKAQYTAAMGSNPLLLSGNQGGSSSVAAYQSRAEVTADMSNPLYRKDPAFRAKVEQRLAISSVF